MDCQWCNRGSPRKPSQRGGIWEIGQVTTNILRKPKLLVKSHPLGWRPGISSLTSLMVHTVFFVNIGIKKFAGRYRAFGYGILFQNCTDLLWKKMFLGIAKNFSNLRLKAKNFEFFFEITKTIFSQLKNEEQNFYLKQNIFLSYSWGFLRSNKFRNSNLEKIIRI